MEYKKGDIVYLKNAMNEVKITTVKRVNSKSLTLDFDDDFIRYNLKTNKMVFGIVKGINTTLTLYSIDKEEHDKIKYENNIINEFDMYFRSCCAVLTIKQKQDIINIIKEGIINEK